MAEQEKQQKQEKEDKDWTPFDEWWGKILGVPFFWGVGVWLYVALGNMEENGGAVRVNWFIALAYKLGGRWGAVGLCGVLGVLFLFWGIHQLRTGKE
jgi:hypothetical protein